ncbi:MAG: cupredoxin domain-containing protein [Polyangiaceae bacterium]
MNRINASVFSAALFSAALLGLVGCGNDNAKPASGSAPEITTAADGTREMKITVSEKGYDPAALSAPAGQKVRLTFTRVSDEGCGQQVAFPSLNIKKDLPLNKPVSVDLTMPASGNLGFTCGMGMYKGSVVVQ